MSYLHCHKCGWSQDDFWSDSYNPITFLEVAWKKSLLEKDIDKKFTNDSQFIEDNGNISLREVIARQLESHAKSIRNMKFRTLEEFNKLNPERKCPICGKQELDID